MGSKTIMVTEEAYDALKRAKAIDESFTDVILRLTPKPTLADFYGAWADMSDDEFKKIEDTIKESRKNFAESIRRNQKCM